MTDDEKITIRTKSGYIVVVESITSGADRISIRPKTSQNTEQTKNSSIEIVPADNSVSISMPTNLHIQAQNVVIEASEELKLKSGAAMTITGSLVKIN